MSTNSTIGRAYPANYSVAAAGIPLPISGGQVSVPDNTYQTLATIDGGAYVETKPDFELEYLPILEILASMNGDVGFSINNIVELANTDMFLDFGDNVPGAKVEKWLKIIERAEKRWYMINEPRRSLVRDLLVQIAINGVLSVEMVPFKNISGIEKIVRVWPYSMRLALDPKTNTVMPFQRPRNWLTANNIQSGGFIRLNPVTYRYSALSRNGNTFYGTPPLLSVLEPILIQRDMVQSLKLAMKKLGLFGALSVLLTPLEKKPGENDEMYISRNTAYMRNQMPEIVNFFNKGIIAGFKDQHEIKLEGGPGEVKGAKDVQSIVDQQVASGLKTQPVFIGRQGTLTETLGRVLMEQQKSKIADYQGLVCSFFRDAILMELLLCGEQVETLNVTMEKPTLGDRLKDAQANKMNTEIAISQRNAGFIDQDTAARQLGYRKAASPFDIALQEKSTDSETAGTDNKTDPAKELVAGFFTSFFSAGEADQETTLHETAFALGAEAPVFDYSLPENCGEPEVVFAEFSKKFDDFLKSYQGKISKLFRGATAEVARLISSLLKTLPDDTTQKQAQQAIIFTLFSNWPKLFKEKTTAVIASEITKIYGFYRSDKSPFEGTIKERPTVSLTLTDYRAIEFSKKFDELYLGKFVTDPDTVKRLKKAIDDNFLVDSKAIGRNSAGIEALTAQFKDTLLNEEFKMRRVVDTTVNRLRNAGNLAYMYQAEVETYEIVEVMDRLTCPHCQHMNGKIFEVAPAYKKMFDGFKGDPAEYVSKNPFATIYKIDKFKELSHEELQRSFASPPYHCNCRGRKVVA